MMRVVALFFSDMEGSTRLAQDLGDDWPPLLTRFQQIVETAITGCGGTVVSTQGDGHFATFPTVADAIASALAAQRGLGQESWTGDVVVRARMGIHVGEVIETPQGLVGLDIHRAARISDAANGGQVVVSAPIVEKAEASEHWSFGDLGEHRLKDLSTPIRLFQLDAPGLATEYPPLRALPAQGHNLPVQLTSFVGRADDVAALRAALNDHRLVTLTGFGGTGKTRLAVQAAAEMIHRFPDGVWLVDLAPITSPELVATEVAETLGIEEAAGVDPVVRVAERLRARTTLLVLDNCEHLSSPVADVAQRLLAGAPRLTILATSRSSMGPMPFGWCACSTGSLWPSSWRPPVFACCRRPIWPTASADVWRCWVGPAMAAPPTTRRWRRRSPGVTTS
jgi:class 3 adenylate cyclase